MGEGKEGSDFWENGRTEGWKYERMERQKEGTHMSLSTITMINHKQAQRQANDGD